MHRQIAVLNLNVKLQSQAALELEWLAKEEKDTFPEGVLAFLVSCWLFGMVQCCISVVVLHPFWIGLCSP